MTVNQEAAVCGLIIGCAVYGLGRLVLWLASVTGVA